MIKPKQQNMTQPNDPISLSEPRRQSPAAVVLILARFIRRLARQLWPLILIVFFQQEQQNWATYLLYFAIAMTVFSMIGSVAAYWRFYYYATADKFVIERGFFNKVKLNVPFDRIQTINFQRGVLHRLLGVVGLEIDTAGSQSKELSIPALTEAEASHIRRFLLEKKRTTSDAGRAEASDPAEKLTGELLLQLDVGDLIKIGFSQNHLRTAGIILAFLFGLYEFVEDLLGEAASKQAAELGQRMLDSFFQFLLFLLPTLLIAAFLLSLVRTVIQYYGLRFFRTPDGYRVIGGLFTEQERYAPFTKIQVTQWQDNPLYRRFGMYALRLKQASSAIVRNRQALNIPGAYPAQVQNVKNAYFPQSLDAPFSLHGIHPAIIGRRTLYFGLAPALALTALTYSPLGFRALIFLAVLPVVWLANRRYHRTWIVALHPLGCQLEHGLWNRYRTLLQWHKVQAVEIRQSPYQRRRELANLYLYTAAGAITIPYLPLGKAVALKDYILFQVETDARDWM